MSLGGMAIALFLGATLLVLLMGVGLMMRGGEMNKKYGNKLMIARVGFQFMVLVMLVLMFVIGTKS